MNTRLLFLFLLVLLCSNLSFAQARVSKTYTKPVMMHYMPWFDTPEFGGSWGYHWTFNNRNPDNLINGKREIASHYYPLIGPYGSSDPDVIEYHLLLMKYAGVDGVLVDWYGEQGSNGDVGSLLRNSNALIDRTDEAGLQFGLIFEDRFTTSVQQGRNNMAYAGRNYFNRPNYFRYNNAPLVGAFGPITFESPEQWSIILGGAGQDVTFLTLVYEADDAGSNADGEYVWIYEEEPANDYYQRMEEYYRNRAPGQGTVMGVAYPGFKDFYAEGGAGSSFFTIPHNETNTLNQVLGLVNQYDSQIDILQLATWNDFGEGTIFEPTEEFGFSFLTTLQDFLGVSYGEAELRQILRLYELRKKYRNDGARQARLNQVYNQFVALEVDRAIAIMDEVDGNNPPPPPPPPDPEDCSVRQISDRIEAESYCRQRGVQVERTTDQGGGENVGGIDTEDYTTYQINVPASGRYTIRYRIASLNGGGNLRFEQGGGARVFATLDVPTTGGWQNWRTIEHTVTLDAGEQELAIVANTGGFNINWWTAIRDGGDGGSGGDGGDGGGDGDGSTYRIKNVWQNTYLYDAGDRVGYSARAGGADYNWVVESTLSGFSEIRNVATGDYMHVEDQNGFVQATTRSPGWWSSQWVIAGLGNGRSRVTNRWQSDQTVHVEDLTGFAQAGTTFPVWQSAQWILEPVPGRIRVPDSGQGAWQSAIAAPTLTIFPNPLTAEALTVDYTGAVDDHSFVEIYDLNGKLVMKQLLTGARTTLSTRGTAAGVYLVTIQSQDKTLTTKLVVR